VLMLREASRRRRFPSRRGRTVALSVVLDAVPAEPAGRPAPARRPSGQLRRAGDGGPRPTVGNASQLPRFLPELCLNAAIPMEGRGKLAVRVEPSDTGCRIRQAHETGLRPAICRSIAGACRARPSGRDKAIPPGGMLTIESPIPVEAPRVRP